MRSFAVILVVCMTINIIACSPANTPPQNKDFISAYPTYNGDTLPISEESWKNLGYENR